jgi:hypothetical protein
LTFHLLINRRRITDYFAKKVIPSSIQRKYRASLFLSGIEISNN